MTGASGNTATDGYTVGQMYRVPCVRVSKHHWLGSGWVPVIGPEHEDAEIVNFPYQHFHIDWRFVSDRGFRAAGGDGLIPSRVLGIPVMREDTHSRAVIEEGPMPMLRKCRRAMPAYPRRPALTAWLHELEAKFANCKMTGMVCPHRGLPLVGAQTDGDVVTCPGHGLRWNFKTGDLVPERRDATDRSSK